MSEHRSLDDAVESVRRAIERGENATLVYRQHRSKPFDVRAVPIRTQPSNDELIDGLKHLAYERRTAMLLALELLKDWCGITSLPFHLKCACLEAFLLHMRVLTEFILENPLEREPTGLFAADFFKDPSVWFVHNKGDTNRLRNEARDANRQLAHISLDRPAEDETIHEWSFLSIARDLETSLLVFRNRANRMSSTNWTEWDADTVEFRSKFPELYGAPIYCSRTAGQYFPIMVSTTSS